MWTVPVGDASGILLGIAAVVSAVGGGIVGPVLAFLARRHAKSARQIATVTAVEVRDQSARVDAIAEHLIESQHRGARIGEELVETMRELRRRNNS